MKINTLLTIWLLGCSLNGISQQADAVISLDLQHARFDEFVRLVEDQTGYQFFYKKDWVADMDVSITAAQVEVTAAVRQVLLGSGLYLHYLQPDRLIILKDRKVVTDLSLLSGPGGEYGSGNKGEQSDVTGGKYMEVTRPEQMVQTIVVGAGGKWFQPDYRQDQGPDQGYG